MAASEPSRSVSRGLVPFALMAALGLPASVALAQGEPPAPMERIPGRPMTPVKLEQGNSDLFSFRVVSTGLESPWSLRYGPDDMLWVTQRTGGAVTRIDPVTGAQQTPLVIEDVLSGSQQGLLGLVLHPELLQGTGNDYVYLSYTYDAAAGEAGAQPDRRGRIVRYAWDNEAEQLIDPVEVLSGIPQGTDHNSGRMQWGPDGMLYYAAGDQGHNQFRNYLLPIQSQRLPTADEVAAQDWTSYTGKVLRLAPDGSIPEDNPEINGVRSHIYTYGHRNPQGIAFSTTGQLYSVEHGPSSDDELNLLAAGANYGWPNVSGYQDDRGYRYVNWSEAPEDLEWEINPLLTEGVEAQSELDFTEAFNPPLASYWVVEDFYPFNEVCGIVCDPTIAPTSVLIYDAGEGGIPEWDNSALMVTLKHGVIYQQPLSEDGTEAVGSPVQWLFTQNRYRDLAFSPDKRSVFLATDTGGAVTPAFGDDPSSNIVHNPGAILMFTYDGE